MTHLNKGRSIQHVISFIVLFSLLPIFSPIHRVSAQSTTSSGVDQCFSLDVIFIVDQSESMSIATNPSDPMEQRKYAIEAAIDQLTDNALDKCSKAIHRIGIVSFGTKAVVDLQMGLINPETENEAKVISARLKANVKTVDLYYTDPLLAFQTARSMFNDSFTDSTVSPDAGLRKKVIIFITDGVPEREKPVASNGLMRELKAYIDENFPFDPTIIKQDDCLNTLRDRYGDVSKAPDADVMTCVSNYPITQQELDSSTYIYGLFLPSNAAYQEIVDIWQQIVDTHEGQKFLLSNNRQDVSSTIRDIISSLIGVKLNVVTCGSFAVNPYLKRAVFTFFKIDPQLKVTLSYQDAKSVLHSINSGQATSTGGFDVGPGDYSVDGSNERYVINRPYPGIWQLTADNCNGLDVYYDPVQIKPGSYQPNLPVEIPEYELPPYYDKYHPLYLEYQIKDIEGITLIQADDPNLAISIDLSITDPSGHSQPYKMVWDSSDSLFRTSEPLQFPVVGEYTINMVGTYMRHLDPVTVNTTNVAQVFTEQTTLFEQKGITFNVHTVTPFLMNLDKPAQNANIGTVHQSILRGWPLKINPVNVSVSFLNTDNTPLDVSNILTDPSSPLTAVITAGTATSDSASLAADPSKPGVYNGQVMNFDAKGSQTVTVTLTSAFDEYHRPQDQVLTATITRRDNLFTSPGTYFVILALLYLYLLVRILFWNYGRKHQLEGYLLAKENGTVLRVLKLFNGTNRNTFDAGFWNKVSGKSLGLRRLVVSSAFTPKESKNPVPADQAPADDGLPVLSKAIIHCEWRSAAKGGSFDLKDMNELPLDPNDQEVRSLQYIASLANSLEYVQLAESVDRKANFVPNLLFVGTLLCALLLTFIMIF